MASTLGTISSGTRHKARPVCTSNAATERSESATTIIASEMARRAVAVAPRFTCQRLLPSPGRYAPRTAPLATAMVLPNAAGPRLLPASVTLQRAAPVASSTAWSLWPDSPMTRSSRVSGAMSLPVAAVQSA